MIPQGVGHCANGTSVKHARFQGRVREKGGRLKIDKTVIKEKFRLTDHHMKMDIPNLFKTEMKADECTNNTERTT